MRISAVIKFCLLLNNLMAVLFYGNCQIDKSVKKQEVDYVNPLIGTSMKGFKEGLGGGGTMPCVGPPFAMTNFVAQTCENRMGRMIYNYEDTSIVGFAATHQPTVWMGDYGYVSIMPEIGALKVLPKQRALNYKHQDEIATPYYYSVKLNANEKKIKTEIAATGKCSILRFTFPEANDAHFVIQGINLDTSNGNAINDINARLNKLKGYVKIDKNNNEITGYNSDRMSYQLGPELPGFKGYFIIQFEKKFESSGAWDQGDIKANLSELYGTQMGAFVNFHTKAGEVLKVKIATSFISIEQARENLETEIPDWDFNKVVNDTRVVWQKNLERIKVEGATEEQKVMLYTALFHSLLFPRDISEYGHYYSAFDDRVHTGESYNDYSLWDTYRALHPLLTIIQPERVNAMVRSLLQMYKEGGWIPKWPNPTYTNIMIGTHGDAVVADAWVKGFRGYDTAIAYEAIRKDAMVPPDCDTKKRWGDRDPWTSYEARGGLSYYHSIGYVPSDKTNESVSRTIEYCVDDYCIARVAKSMGKTADFEQLARWSENYKNVYDKQSGFMAPRLYNGDWSSNPKEGFTEGSTWDYLFGAVNDIPGMIKLYGGDAAFARKLDETFRGGHYRLDNEPGQHYPYLYDYCHQSWKTQKFIRELTSSNYLNEPNGIDGNDDCGQMSAWYIFSVIGFYPVTPASGIYAIGAPQIPGFTVTLNSNGKSRQLEIVAKNLSKKNMYVQSVTFNGRKLKEPFIRHSDLVEGGRLIFVMGADPNGGFE